MSETVAKQRPTVDLDEFERRLRQQAPHDDDPLAEMARLVGEQHDPYGDVFAREADAHPPRSSADDHHYGQASSPPPAKLFGDFAAIEAGLRGTTSPHATPASYQDPGRSEPMFDARPEQGYHHDPAFDEMQAREFQAREMQARHPAQGYHEQEPVFGNDAGYDQSAGYQGQDWAYDDRAALAPPVTRSRRPVYLMAATIGVCLVGIGAAFALKGHSRSPGEIKTIMAASGPTKIQPPEDAAHEQVSQDAAVTGAANGPAPTKLVSREEQPVDVAQAAQDNAARDAAARPETNASSVPVPLSPDQAQNAGRDAASASTGERAAGDKDEGFNLSGFPAPKRVKVVSVRPDGTILSNDEAAAAPAPRQNKTSDKAGAVAKTSTPKTTSRIAPKPTRAEDATAPDATPSDTAAAVKAKPQRVATADPGEQNTDAAVEPVVEGAGGFAVQLAAPASEADAKAALNKYVKKYSGVLTGHHLGYHRASSNGKTVYRLRVSSLSKEQAVSMCEKLKSEGGTCFVAKN